MEIGATYVSSFLFNLGLILLCTIPVVQLCSVAFAGYIHFSDLTLIFGLQINYLRFYTLFSVNHVFIWMLVLLSPVSVIYLFFVPLEISPSAMEFKELLEQ
eukprot:gene4645-5897_t